MFHFALSQSRTPAEYRVNFQYWHDSPHQFTKNNITAHMASFSSQFICKKNKIWTSAPNQERHGRRKLLITCVILRLSRRDPTDLTDRSATSHLHQLSFLQASLTILFISCNTLITRCHEQKMFWTETMTFVFLILCISFSHLASVPCWINGYIMIQRSSICTKHFVIESGRKLVARWLLHCMRLKWFLQKSEHTKWKKTKDFLYRAI